METKIDENNVKNLEVGTVIADTNYNTYEILKKISDGYILLYYSSSHKVYSTDFIEFDKIVEYGYIITDDEWEVDVFNGDNMKHNPIFDDSFLPTDE